MILGQQRREDDDPYSSAYRRGYQMGQGGSLTFRGPGGTSISMPPQMAMQFAQPFLQEYLPPEMAQYFNMGQSGFGGFGGFGGGSAAGGGSAGGAGQGGLSQIGQGVSNVGQALGQGVTGLSNAIGGGGQAIGSGLGAAGQAVGQGAAGAAGAIGSGVSGAAGALGSGMGAAASGIGSAGAGLGAAVGEGASAIGAGLGALIGMIFSDRRVKRDVEPVRNALDAVKTLRAYRYRYVGENGSERHIGLMAQDVEKVCPEAVQEVNGIKMVNIYAVASLVGQAAAELTTGAA